MKKILFIILALSLASCCDPDKTFSREVDGNSTEWVEPGYVEDVPEITETELLRRGISYPSHIIYLVTYGGHDYLVVFYYGESVAMVHSESCPCKQ